ncbi:alpha/beta fold hydrolase [Actinacidiphila alni]|nr:alpha/beta hydrolase [Actinacidiphila alni]
MTPRDEHDTDTDTHAGAAEAADRTPDDTVLPLPGGGLRVRQDGPRDAPPLLLIHGSASSLGVWDAMVPLLTGCHRVVRVDLPGHGGSAAPADGDYSVPEQARRVGAALDRLGVGRVTVVGHSSGGYVATALAEERPALVGALVLVNTGPSLDAFTGPETAGLDPAAWPPGDDVLRHFASSAFRTGFAIPQRLIDELRTADFPAVATAMRASTAYLAERPLPDRLIPLGTPLHVVFGAQDRRWRPSSAAAYSAVPSATVTYLPRTGHTPPIEDPHRTAAVLLAFTTARV